MSTKYVQNKNNPAIKYAQSKPSNLDSLCENLNNDWVILPVRYTRKTIKTTKVVDYMCTVDRFTWVNSGAVGADDEYNDYIDYNGRLQAQGSSDMAICVRQAHKGKAHGFYANNIAERAIWNAGTRSRKVGYRRYEHALTTNQTEKVDFAFERNHRVINAIVAKFDIDYRICSKNGKLLIDASCKAGTILKHDGYVK